MEKTDLNIAAGKATATAQQTLAIVFQDDGYSFCIAGGNPFVLSRLFSDAYPQHWATLMPGEQFTWLQGQHPELKNDFKRVHLALQTSKSTLLPSAVYRDGTGTDYFELVFGRTENEQLHRDSLSAIQSELISAMPVGFATAAALHFHSLRLYSLEAALAMRWHRQQQQDERDCIYAHLHDNHLLAWHFQGQNLQLANRYELGAAADVLYYLSLLASGQQLKIVLSGRGKLLDETHLLLSKYYAHLNWLDHDPLLAFDPQWSNLPPAGWQALFACLCAS